MIIFKRLFLLALVFIIFSGSLHSQTINSERKLIVGTWISTEADWTFIFDKDSLCKEYMDKQLISKYAYKVTSANSYCGKISKVNLNDQSISYLQLNNLETKEITCYEINGVSTRTLSITEYMMPEPALFRRKVVQKIPNK
ncbi:hypothetical protein [Sediminibacterium sp.]|uniref:hypothetical protein n=1 Tax=Sediminibacterium sp. TaxID=1917865 RepID=UPI003F6F519E